MIEKTITVGDECTLLEDVYSNFKTGTLCYAQKGNKVYVLFILGSVAIVKGKELFSVNINKLETFKQTT